MATSHAHPFAMHPAHENATINQPYFRDPDGLPRQNKKPLDDRSGSDSSSSRQLRRRPTIVRFEDTDQEGNTEEKSAVIIEQSSHTLAKTRFIANELSDGSSSGAQTRDIDTRDRPRYSSSSHSRRTHGASFGAGEDSNPDDGQRNLLVWDVVGLLFLVLLVVVAVQFGLVDYGKNAISGLLARL